MVDSVSAPHRDDYIQYTQRKDPTNVAQCYRVNVKEFSVMIFHRYFAWILN